MPFDTPSEETWTCIIHPCVFFLPGSEVKGGAKDLAGLCSQLDKNLTSCKKRKKKKLTWMKDYCQHRSWYLRRFHRLFLTAENVCDPEWLAQTLLFTADIFKAFAAHSSVTALAQTYRRDVARSTRQSKNDHLIWDVTMTFLFQRQGSLRHRPREAFCLPVEVWFVFIHVDVVERILSEPGVDGKAVLVRPFGYWWQRYGLVEDRHTGSCTVYVYRYITWIQCINLWCVLSLSSLFPP